jgi:hypothetical protein
MTAEAMAEREGKVLLGWLRLLGWTVVIERNGGTWSGSARRPAPAGEVTHIDGSAASQRELVTELFRTAIRGLAPQPA